LANTLLVLPDIPPGANGTISSMGCLGAAFAAMQKPKTAALKNWRNMTVTPLVWSNEYITF
jgi:hypothetical protein